MFTHLHVHSHYSLLDGLGKIDQLLERAQNLKMNSLALTDHGAMYGIIEFYEKAKEMDIKPILGVETYVAPRSHTDKSAQIDTKPYHLILLAENNEGYQNLLKLVSIAHLEGYYYKPRVDKTLLKKYHKGLIAASACLVGEVPQAATSGNLEHAAKVTKEYQDIFGKENFFLELQDHPEIPEQDIANKALIDIAKKLNIPLIATNDIHYVRKEDREAHDILVCVQTGKTIEDPQRMTYDGNFSMRTPEEMKESFSDIPEALENTGKIAQRCRVELQLGKEILPIYPLPKGKTDNHLLKEMCLKNLPKRYGKDITPELKERLDFELKTVEKMGYASYFLIVQDFVNYAKDNGIAVGPGRGSAAGSIITYLLNITDLNPLKYGLLFERFLNPDRIEMPDIDIDFADTHRGEVLEYVRKKYTDEHVAGIITFGTMAARAAVRDTGRALGISYAEVDRIAKLIPPPVQGRHIPIQKSLEDTPDLKAVYESEPAAKRLLDMAGKLEGTVRHASQHACAIVISRDKLTTYLPLQKAQKGDVAHVTQYSMNPVSHIGLLKMDILGLANLSIIGRTLEIIEAVWGKKIRLTELPLDDKKTFALFARADTTGVFQLESSGMKRYIKDLKPTKLDDITAMVALYRPGPLQFIESFIRRKHDREPITYPHPLVENALKATYGIPLYQEQVMQIAKDMALFSGGEADTLRKAMGKKIAKLMEEMKVKFIAGAARNNVTEKKAIEVFKMLQDFAAYGFNKSHAACYAFIAYQTAYLKAHFPAEFMAALMTSDLGDTERVAIEIEECEHMSLKVLPPDVNESFVDFGVVVGKDVAVPINDEKDAPKVIRFGLAAIKNVGMGVAKAIVKERKKSGQFESFTNFINRCSKIDQDGGNSIINKKNLEALAKSGALDSLIERNRCLENIDTILKFAGQKSRLPTNQVGLFSTGLVELPEESLELVSVAAATDKDRLVWEKELLGIYLSEHPLHNLAKYISQNALTIASLTQKKDGEQVNIIGIVTNIKKITTKSGQLMAFAGLEDMSGSTEVIVFPKILDENKELWVADKVVEIKGKISTKDNAVKILVDKAVAVDADEIAKNQPQDDFIEIDLTNDAPIALKNRQPSRHLADNKRLPRHLGSGPAVSGNFSEVKEVSGRRAGGKISEYLITIPRGTKKEILLELKKILQKYPGKVPVALNIPRNGTFDQIPTKTQVKPSLELDEEIKKIFNR